MTPDLLRAAGVALYGSRWQADVARATGTHRHTVMRWDRGEFAIPDTVRERLLSVANERSVEIRRLKKALEGE